MIPGYPGSFHGEGAVLEFLGRRELARRAYNEALLLDPDHVPSLLNLAALLWEVGEKEQAGNMWRRLLTLDISSQEKRDIKKLLQEK